ncbi:putative glyoxalase family protein [Rosellinia necatrix]|uniref:Putative glyoxalase family protein n=1 Tax=Rosellinia necatrix TaxID=77044 RepID=A0A1W2TTR3_ROSNE|nr:putative glyoxalase family protein [Rosellinia necatrix]
MAAAAAPRKIQLVRIAHVYYKYKDLEDARRFLLDFGFSEEKKIGGEGEGETIYFRGYGTEPWVLCATRAAQPEFGGAAFVVESDEDLRIAAETLPGASAVYELADAPGGGRCVTFHDPVDGWPMHLVHGQRSVDMLDIPLPRTPVNYPTEKNRPANKTQRFTKRPAPIHKLGHFGVRTTSFAKAHEFYCSRFNLIASDIVHDAEGIDRTVFYRLNRGDEEVDHHSFFLAEGASYKVHHSSYETHDFDTQVLGHDWLREKGHKNCWGVGRHVLGSQIFDYWFDPSGFIFEHYVDGDLVTADEPTHRSQAGPGSLHAWGPDVPSSFLE